MEVVQVPLSDIRIPDLSELDKDKILNITKDVGTFEEQLNSKWNPIRLDRGAGKPYKIIDGRHRVWQAAKRGYRSVPAVFG